MLKKYRRDFVLLNITLVGLTLLLTLMVLCLYMHRNYQNTLRMTMSEFLRPMSTDSAANASPQEDIQLTDNDRQRILTVIYRGETDHVTVLSQDPSLTGTALLEAVRAAYGASEDFGTLSGFDLIYYKERAGDDWKIALTGRDYITAPMTKLIITMVLIFLGALTLFYFVSRYTAMRATKPIAEAWTREKRFIADASHELKTPLTVMLANISILRFQPELRVSEQMRWIDSMETTANSMRALVADMLSLSEMDATSAESSKTAVNFSDIVTKALLQFDAVAYDKGVRLETALAEDAVLTAHSDRLSRVTAVLLENALKYEPTGGSVSVTLEQKKGETSLTVKNGGACIAPEDIPHVFDRFYRANTDKAGHGLGLSIAKQLTELEGGTISVSSTKDEGTAFCVVFK